MKIAFISDAAFPWHFGGLEAVERAEAEELAKAHEVHFYSMQWPGMKKDFVENGIHYHGLMKVNHQQFYRHGRRAITTEIVFMFSTFKMFLSGQRFDVVEVNMFPFLHIPIMKVYCKLTGCKMILDVVEIWSKKYWVEYIGGFLGRLAYWYAGFFADSANAYIANSTATAKGLLGEGVNKERINIFLPVLDDKLLDKLEMGEKRKPIVIFWGRLIKEKRIDLWLDVVAETSKKVKGLRGLIIGHGPEYNNIKEMIKQKKLERIVEIRPSIKDKLELFKVASECSALLHMSEREGLSVIALESLMLGLPVLLPSYSPIPNEVKEMCVVEKKEDLPEKLAEIVRSKDKGRYIRNRDGLKRFFISNVVPFYDGLFKNMGIGAKHQKG